MEIKECLYQHDVILKKLYTMIYNQIPLTEPLKPYHNNSLEIIISQTFDVEPLLEIQKLLNLRITRSYVKNGYILNKNDNVGIETVFMCIYLHQCIIKQFKIILKLDFDDCSYQCDENNIKDCFDFLIKSNVILCEIIKK